MQPPHPTQIGVILVCHPGLTEWQGYAQTLPLAVAMARLGVVIELISLEPHGALATHRAAVMREIGGNPNLLWQPVEMPRLPARWAWPVAQGALREAVRRALRRFQAAGIASPVLHAEGALPGTLVPWWRAELPGPWLWHEAPAAFAAWRAAAGGGVLGVLADGFGSLATQLEATRQCVGGLRIRGSEGTGWFSIPQEIDADYIARARVEVRAELGIREDALVLGVVLDAYQMPNGPGLQKIFGTLARRHPRTVVLGLTPDDPRAANKRLVNKQIPDAQLRTRRVVAQEAVRNLCAANLVCGVVNGPKPDELPPLAGLCASIGIGIIMNRLPKARGPQPHLLLNGGPETEPEALLDLSETPAPPPWYAAFTAQHNAGADAAWLLARYPQAVAAHHNTSQGATK